MKTYVRDMWADALESGDYAQTTGHLRTETGYCCLGVLCDLYRKETGAGEWRLCHPTASFYKFIDSDGADMIGALPVGVMAWAGLTSIDPELRDEDGDAFLASSWNDDEGSTFSEIAAMVRALPGEGDS